MFLVCRHAHKQCEELVPLQKLDKSSNKLAEDTLKKLTTPKT